MCMPKAITFQEMKTFIDSNNRELLTTEDEFYRIKNDNNTLPSQTKMNVRCCCLRIFPVTFNQFQSKGKRSCNDCGASILKEKIYPEERINSVIQMYNDGIKMNEISKTLGMKSETVSVILKENNVKIRNNTDYKTSEELSTNRKYEFNKNFFETINTQNKAYWLGFIYADGNVYIKNYNEGKSKGGRLEIGLQLSDEYHLLNFLNDIEATTTPVEYRKIKLEDKVYDACRINLNNIKLAKDLISHGCIPNKSLKLEFPTTVPDHLIHHFMRGYIDGDGCVGFYTYDKTDTFCVSILGTEKFLETFKQTLRNYGINSNVIRKEKSKAFSMGITGQDNLVKLYDFLYSDASVFLGRKIDKVRQALIYFKKEFSISETAKLFYLFDDELLEKMDLKEKRSKLSVI